MINPQPVDVIDPDPDRIREAAAIAGLALDEQVVTVKNLAILLAIRQTLSSTQVKRVVLLTARTRARIEAERTLIA